MEQAAETLESVEAKKKKSLANVKSPIIQAMLSQSYVFATRVEAIKKLEFIEERFVRSSLSDEIENHCIVIWIRGYDVTKEEEAQGCVGNFAVVGTEMMPDGKYTISARKIVVEASKHPQRKRKKGKHPDWGYWVLRRIQKGWRYDSIDEAYHDLMKLVEDFPEVTIPSQNKVYTIIYRKKEDGSLPLFRVILEVEALPQGGFTITCKENTYRKDEKVSAPKEVEAAQPEQVGRFTSMVAVKRNKRKNIADLVKPAQAEDEKQESE